MLNNRPVQPYMRRKLAQSFAINVGYLIQHKRASAGLDQTDLALLVETVGNSNGYEVVRRVDAAGVERREGHQ